MGPGFESQPTHILPERFHGRITLVIVRCRTKRFALLFAALVVLGCSSPFKITFHNQSGQAVEVKYEYKAHSKVEKEELTIGGGEAVDKLVWFGTVPEYLKVEVQGGPGFRLSRKFQPQEFPPELQKSSSMGSRAHLYVTPTALELRSPTGYQRDPLGYILTALFLFAAAAFALFGACRFFLQVRRRRLSS